MEKLMQFLDASVSTYHAIDALKQELESAGYTRILEQAKWELVPGGKYYLIRGGSSLIAFRIPKEAPKGFLFSAAHSDRPSFKLKENGELAGKYTRLTTEKYGGLIISPWLDRPLSIAGRVMVETEDGIESRLVNIDKDLLLIPNVAIHLNRKVNEGYAWNPAVDTLPLVGGENAKGKIGNLLEEAAGGKILGHDLYLYIRQKASVWGVDEEFLSAAGLDDLLCAWCCTQGFLTAQESSAIPVLCIFDSEEVGSSSVQGAASRLLQTTVDGICAAMQLDSRCLLSNSMMLSADNANGLHPNHPEFSDANNAPVMNGGVVLKFNANMRYTTDGFTAAVVRKLAKKAGVPVQPYYNRADLVGGSTLGNISLSQVSVPSADIGLAQLAMHSCYETAGAEDAMHLKTLLQVYYSADLRADGEGGVKIS